MTNVPDPAVYSSQSRTRSRTVDQDAGRLTVMIAFTGEGGVENMIINLLRAFLAEGMVVDLLLLKEHGRHVTRIPEGINVIRLNAVTSLTALPAVVRYLRARQPCALLVAKDRASRIALLARWIAGVNTRVVLRMGMHLSGSLATKSALRRWSRFLPVRWLYPWADRIVTVSEAVADDLATISGMPRERFTVIRNPSISDDLESRAKEPLSHPWLAQGERVPVILGVGRLTAQKDFETLLDAFAQLRARHQVRLIILGEGPLRGSLERRAQDLGISDDVDLAGFQLNPYAWMARASLFVLSSRFEGSPNVLVETMALGVPVVATDCPSGPREILQDGRIAPLVPVGDSRALAQAMTESLRHPPHSEALREAVSEYHATVSARRYLDVLGCPL